MAYTYRFLDVNNNVIYVGYTWNIDKRISDHFTRGHLPNKCYEKIARIECIKWKTYRVYKNINAPVKLKWGWVQIAFLLYLIYIIINFVANRLQ